MDRQAKVAAPRINPGNKVAVFSKTTEIPLDGGQLAHSA